MILIENTWTFMYNNDNDNERKIHPEVRMKVEHSYIAQWMIY